MILTDEQGNKYWTEKMAIGDKCFILHPIPETEPKIVMDEQGNRFEVWQPTAHSSVPFEGSMCSGNYDLIAIRKRHRFGVLVLEETGEVRKVERGEHFLDSEGFPKAWNPAITSIDAVHFLRVVGIEGQV